MASTGLRYCAEIDSIGDIVTGDLRRRWKCQELEFKTGNSMGFASVRRGGWTVMGDPADPIG